MSKWEPKTYVLKNGQTLLLREAVPDDAPRVLAYLNRVGGESDNLLFGKDGFPMPVERERVAHRAGLSVTVGKGFWGLGIGRKAMEALIAFAKGAGLEVLQLEGRSDNERAVTLYEHLGFEKMGLYKKFMKVDGRDFDAWYMNLYL